MDLAPSWQTNDRRKSVGGQRFPTTSISNINIANNLGARITFVLFSSSRYL